MRTRQMALTLGLAWNVGVSGMAYAQGGVPLDYLAGIGACEISQSNRELGDGWLFDMREFASKAGATIAIDRGFKYAGTGSQRMEFNRAEGDKGEFGLHWLLQPTYLHKPEAGTVVRVQFAYSARDFQNASYYVIAETGKRIVYLLPESSAPTDGWQTVQMDVPVEVGQTGRPYFRLRFRVKLDKGASAGKFWFDEVKLLRPDVLVSPPPQPPNPIRIHTSITSEADWTRFLEVPMSTGFLGPYTSQKALIDFQPGFESALTMSAIFTIKGDWARHNADAYRYNDAIVSQTEWFLRRPDGRIDYNEAYPDRFLMDIANPQVQARMFESIQSLVERSFMPKWVYLDNFTLPVYNRISRYPTADSWADALKSLIEYLQPRVQQTYGAGVIVNIGSNSGALLTYPGSDPGPGYRWLPHLSGFLLERAFTGRAGDKFVYRPYGKPGGDWTDHGWRSDLRAITENPTKRILVVVCADPDDKQMRRYAIASYLITQHPNTRFRMYDTPAGSTKLFVPHPDVYVPLGNATSDYQILQGTLETGGLFYREYEQGVVLVNPTPNLTFSYTPTRDYRDWDGNPVPANEPVVLKPHTGLALTIPGGGS
ncbi:MAG: hypothetical protein KIT45_07955 [Fimbriimonadia bacterium]|nr:hypothetical protein [Fimbriimonadia bacterium]